VLLSIRGVLLWAIVPLATCAWLLLSLWLLRKEVGLGRFLGWVDLNLVAFLERSILRPFVRTSAPWVPVNAMPGVEHRIRLIDAA
jgi:hypothetical protein